MKKTLMSAAAVMSLAFGLAATAQAQDTLKKIKDSGSILRFGTAAECRYGPVYTGFLVELAMPLSRG